MGTSNQAVFGGAYENTLMILGTIELDSGFVRNVYEYDQYISNVGGVKYNRATREVILVGNDSINVKVLITNYDLKPIKFIRIEQAIDVANSIFVSGS